jgi:hypothetical protein
MVHHLEKLLMKSSSRIVRVRSMFRSIRSLSPSFFVLASDYFDRVLEQRDDEMLSQFCVLLTSHTAVPGERIGATRKVAFLPSLSILLVFSFIVGHVSSNGVSSNDFEYSCLRTIQGRSTTRADFRGSRFSFFRPNSRC